MVPPRFITALLSVAVLLATICALPLRESNNTSILTTRTRESVRHEKKWDGIQDGATDSVCLSLPAAVAVTAVLRRPRLREISHLISAFVFQSGQISNCSLLCCKFDCSPNVFRAAEFDFSSLTPSTFSVRLRLLCLQNVLYLWMSHELTSSLCGSIWLSRPFERRSIELDSFNWLRRGWKAGGLREQCNARRQIDHYFFLLGGASEQQKLPVPLISACRCTHWYDHIRTLTFGKADIRLTRLSMSNECYLCVTHVLPF